MADEGLSGVLGGGGSQGNANDPLTLANSDNPGAQLVSFQFSGSNFLGWSRGIQLALGAKNKLGFIDGACGKPPIESVDFQRWIRADYMVRCWILNSMVNSISESFMCVESAKDLWSELSERYGQSNAPLVFQLRKELIHITKGDKTIAEYFNKLKRIWDELQSVEGLASCDCGAMAACTCQLIKKMSDSEGRNRLMQFLVGLGEGYESVCNTILATDPLPTINKAYSIVQQFEGGKGVSNGASQSDNMALVAARRGLSQNDKFQGNRKDFKKDNKDKICYHCRSKGHIMENCFKLHGYPEWYKGPKDGRSANNAFDATENELESPLEEGDGKGMCFNTTSSGVGSSTVGKFDPSLVNALCQEVLKAMQEKTQVNCATVTNMAGPWH